MRGVCRPNIRPIAGPVPWFDVAWSPVPDAGDTELADDAAFDHDRLLAEIDAEVRRRRASGELNQEVERELDLVFARYAPPAAVADDPDALIEAIDRAGFIDVDGPLVSSRRSVSQAKRAVRKATAFQFRHVAGQVGSLATTVRLAMRALADRVDDLTDAVPAASPVVADARSMAPPTPSDFPLVTVPELLAGVEGRVAHLGAAAGELVRTLRDAGIDAYGVDADPRRIDGADEMDVRFADPFEHLTAIADGVLAGLVVSLDAEPVARNLSVAAQAPRVLRPGGRLVVTGMDPRTWAAARTPVEVDLALGRPLAPETWELVLAGHGMTDVATTWTQVPAAPPADGALGDWLRDLSMRTLGRGWYVVSATA